MKATILIRYKEDVPDVAGRTVTARLSNLGFSEVKETRIGKVIDLQIESGDRENAEVRLEEICEKLLANTQIEEYQILSVE